MVKDGDAGLDGLDGCPTTRVVSSKLTVHGLNRRFGTDTLAL